MISYQPLHPENTTVLDLKGESYAISAMTSPDLNGYAFNPLDVFQQGLTNLFEEVDS
ncbi:hypothetical protein [Agarilytica rhodophyticola]|uniref:hypothetical protein n=1 Tax=Agarilytica rhodophyticola TaxID=1737490 RepID=UPI0013153F67|nr:hypothetical protein [Agarilytica rhodophyticola]